MSAPATIRLGYEVGTGAAVDIPLAHTFITGQTQLSGKTTTLRAIVERAGQRALAFVTKRGETFDGRRIRPYLPREGDKQIHWRLVEIILAAALGTRALKYERVWLIHAAKGATSLQGVRDNVERLKLKAKGQSSDAYLLIGEYLDLVLPEMQRLNAAPTLDLQPGLNVMDLIDVGPQLQAMVIRAALEHINRHEKAVLTVFPEAWEFAPRNAAAPAKDEAIAMVRKGAVLKNFLLCDSQDIAGVDTTIRQGCSVWILGVQRELNEVKRTLQMLPAGIKRPKADDITGLELGQFYACWGRQAVKVYVQPAWMVDADAQDIATGDLAVGTVKGSPSSFVVGGADQVARFAEAFERASHTQQEETDVTKDDADRLTQENTRLLAENADLRRRLEALEVRHGQPTREEAPPPEAPDRRPRVPAPAPVSGPGPAPRPSPRTFTAEESLDNEALYQAFKARLIDEGTSDPALLRVLTTAPELEVVVARRTLTADGDSLRGRVARLLADGWFDTVRGATATTTEMKRHGWNHDYRHIDRSCRELAEQGFFRIESGGVIAVPSMKVRILEA